MAAEGNLYNRSDMLQLLLEFVVQESPATGLSGWCGNRRTVDRIAVCSFSNKLSESSVKSS